MGTIPTSPSFTPGEKLTAAKLNQMNDVANFWALTPRCNVFSAANQSLTSGTTTVLAMGSEVYDIVQSGDTPSHDLVTDNSRVFIRTSGKYDLTAQVTFAANATGQRVIQIRKNAAGNPASGTLLIQSTGDNIGAGTAATVATPAIGVPLVAGDYIELFALQNTGVALNALAGQGLTLLSHVLTGA